ncbi:DNA topoisomerase-1 [Chitinophaga niastensis]|uniref:DNA topoisomerase 1 n=1 Tax=Chitinophaga niastensis TaxID=536980 RepID=A0A2P8HKS4_CHINA|nr:type I DNA topoisomerase [Chitinophaga niastensis]PSL46817.1 DNA topoisomerase-1 [Chitinophaga niastensis]
MAKNLVIVESPAKAKTIEKILGKDFEVKSCFGHIRDLEKDDMGIDIENNFKPKYVIPEDKEKVVKELKKLAKDTDEVWLATDEDREGEAISWHLCEVLNLDPATTKRIVFHEITKPAIENAVLHPRTLDMDRVNAQQARRILDRIVGFELSPVLWRKMSMRNSLSAGRVQSVAVRLIVEREREINTFNSVSTFKVEAYFTGKDINGKSISFKADGPGRFKTAEDAEKFLEQCKRAAYTVKDIQVKPGKKSPAAPFTTSTLQQEASRKLGYSVSKTMLLAQKLYESGNITYMRTDSVSLSDTAIGEIEKAIKTSFGDRYHQHRKFKNKNESAQEAHEAIRPTYMENTTVDDSDTRKLYELIWKRTIASQMSDAELEKTIAKIDISTNHEELTASGEVLKFDGFLKVYMESHDDEDESEEDAQEGSLPPLAVKQSLDLKEMKATERFSRPAPRYTEASLVKKLEELGIGRPSTYAPTITTIQKRNYVEKRDKEGIKRDYRILSLKADEITKVTEAENTGAEKSKLFPTDLGMIVTDFLNQYFNNVMDYGFTAKIEGEFDEIASGKKVWNNMLKEFYFPFHKDVENTLENAERVKGERPLGTDAASGKPIVARMGRYGPMIQIGSVEDEEKPRFAKLKATQSIETITMDEAMELFKLPRNLGQFEGSDVIVNIGRFGPYAQHDKKFYSLKKEMDPYTVELDEVAPLIAEKRTAKDERTIQIFEKEKIQVLKGPYGPYIKQGLKNYKIPKEKIDNAATLTVEEAKAIIEEAKANPPKKKAPPRKKKAE